jgi:hypothetical protein
MRRITINGNGGNIHNNLFKTIDLVLIDHQGMGKRSLFDGHCQCEKEMDNHLLKCQQIDRKPHSDPRILMSKPHF